MSQLVIEPLNGPDADEFAAMLRRMYAAWKGPLDGEQGIHRLVQQSENDPERRRCTSSAVVRVDGEAAEDLVRTYVLSPYRLVHDHRTGRRTEEADRVLGGELSLIREAFGGLS
jgi:protein subunit release factor B